MGASDKAAGQISDAIRQEAEAQLAEKKFVTGEVNIKENVDKIKVAAESKARCNRELLCPVSSMPVMPTSLSSIAWSIR